MRPDGNLVNKQLSHTVCQDRVMQRHRAAPVTQSSCLHPDEPPAFIKLSGESIKMRSVFHAAIFLLDLCTIKSLNPLDRDSLSLCPFQYSADTKRFIVYNCIRYLSKHSVPLSRKHIGGKNH